MLSTFTVAVTVLIHGYGLAILVRLLMVMKIDTGDPPHSNLHFDLRSTMPVLFVVLALFAIHGLEIWFYALVFLALGAMPHLEQAIYFSTITYATIGYSDMHLTAKWRVLAAIEGINGVILMGWSTAFFITIVARLRR